MTIAVSIITFILAIVLIISETAIGYYRGLRRNLIRAAVICVVAILLLFIAPPLAKSIANKPAIAGKISASLLKISDFSKENSKVLQDSAVNAIAICLSPIVYVALFFLFKLFTWGIFIVILRYRNKQLGDNKPVLSKKDRIYGAVVGGVYSLLIGAILFMPLSAYSEYIAKSTQIAMNADAKENVYSIAFGNKNYQAITNYRKSPAYHLYQYTGTKLIGDAMFASLSSDTIKGNKYTAKTYIESVSTIYYSAKTFMSGVSDTSDQTGNEKFIASLNTLVDEFADKNLLVASEDEKVSLLNNLIHKPGGISKNLILKNMLENTEYSSLDAFKNDMGLFSKTATLLNEKDVLSDFLKDSSDGSKANTLDKLDETTINQIADQLYNMDAAEAVVPTVIATFLDKALGEGQLVVDSPEITQNFPDTKEDFITVCNTGKRIADYLNNQQAVKDEESTKVFQEDVKKLKNNKLISSQTYNKLQTIIESKLEK